MIKACSCKECRNDRSMRTSPTLNWGPGGDLLPIPQSERHTHSKSTLPAQGDEFPLPTVARGVVPCISDSPRWEQSSGSTFGSFGTQSSLGPSHNCTSWPRILLLWHTSQCAASQVLNLGGGSVAGAANASSAVKTKTVSFALSGKKPEWRASLNNSKCFFTFSSRLACVAAASTDECACACACLRVCVSKLSLESALPVAQHAE